MRVNPPPGARRGPDPLADFGVHGSDALHLEVLDDDTAHQVLELDAYRPRRDVTGAEHGLEATLDGPAADRDLRTRRDWPAVMAGVRRRIDEAIADQDSVDPADIDLELGAEAADADVAALAAPIPPGTLRSVAAS